MKVKLLREQAGKMDRHSDWPKVGSVVDLWEPKAQYLISVGDAEPVYATGGRVETSDAPVIGEQSTESAAHRKPHRAAKKK